MKLALRDEPISDTGEPHFLEQYALAPVPRYTSYPPANRFNTSVTENDYRRWLGAIQPDETLSLYLHIPFCQSLCWYCGCHTTVPNQDERVSDYVEALLGEIDLISREVNSSASVTHVHLGGGTPNYLNPNQLDHLLNELRLAFGWGVKPEIAIEIDPRCLTKDHVDVVGRYGAPRFSIGVQDVSSDIQSLINRIQPFEAVEDCVERIRKHAHSGINIDLMYGLPGQTVEHLEKSIDYCVALRPERFSVFGYAHVPWFKKHQRAIDDGLLPGALERFRQAETARRRLIACGYVPIGFDHYAKPGDPLAQAQADGRLRRNFQGYTADPTDILIGLGASSIGTFAQGYVQNEPHLLKYRTAIGAGRLGVARGVELSDQDRRIRSAINHIMCRYRVDLSQFMNGSNAAGFSFQFAFDSLAPLSKDGLVRIDGQRVTVTEMGRPYIRNIAACFDQTLVQKPQCHAKAI